MRKPFIIAEIGINHNGDVNIAKLLISLAWVCDCDAVKFQKRTIDEVYTPEFLDSPRESPWGKTQRAQKEGLEFGRKEYDEIDAHCRALGIEWFASAWDVMSLGFLAKYDLKYNKVASPMLTNIPFVEMVADEGKMTFISTGMSTYEDIDRAMEIFHSVQCPLVLMHTVSIYPLRDDCSNLMMIKTLKDRYGCAVGYSGHEVGLLQAPLAVALGAVAIERHITLDRSMYGSDQAASVEKAGLEKLVRDCRLVDVMFGDGVKKILPGEAENAKKMRYWL